MDRFTGLLGMALLLAFAVLLSQDRRRIAWRVVIGGVLLQASLALIMLRVPGATDAFDAIARVLAAVISCADAGIVFIFGEKLADPAGPWGFVFAVKVLPIIIFFASLMAVLYHVGFMPLVVRGLAWALQRTLGVSATEALAAAANIFLGQTEAPLCVRPYLATMTRSQLMAVMTGGFATIAGSVMGAFVVMLGGDDPEARVLFAKHLLTASVMSAPAGFVMAKVLLPETEPISDAHAVYRHEQTASNALDAAARGASDGARLALNVAVMLVAFVSLIALANLALGWFGGLVRVPQLSLETILGVLLGPVAWALGVPHADAAFVGSLMGKQVTVTEFVAYTSLADALRAGTVSPVAAQMATYALCGFANLPSIAIQIGGLSALAPSRRDEFVSLAPRAMVGGAMACWMTAAIAGIVIK